jgi:hypothetical protein
LIISGADQEKPMTFLGNTEISGIEDAVFAVFREPIARTLKFRYQFGQDARMSALCHTGHVLHYEIARSEFRHNTKEVKDKLISHVIDKSFTNERKSLTRGPPSDEIEFTIPCSRVDPVSG